MTQIEALAHAVLQRDEVAQSALLDALIESRQDQNNAQTFDEFVAECSVRLRKGIRRSGINSFSELLKYSPSMILGIKNVGRTTLYELQQRLRKRNMVLRDEERETW